MSDTQNRLKILADEIIQLRKARGWAQTDLAFHSKVPRGTISNIEQGRFEPRRENLSAIAKALGVNRHVWDRLLSGKDTEIAGDALDLAALLDTATPEIRKLVQDWMLLPSDRQQAFADAVRAMLAALRTK